MVGPYPSNAGHNRPQRLTCHAQALERLRALEPDLRRMREAVNGAEEVVRLAPARWKRRRDVERFRHAIDHLEPIVLECRDLARWAADGRRTAADYADLVLAS
ncbi:hypothetical protein ACQEVZ_45425 [Dactylosporangium sp. CA-152071]|uniref:hypothetical protein n=1 Tax=Dactylosporangium sp. CA-152071 TaxID=3239933 RepID=UPI003D8D0B8C